jgi:hypothetical protein
MLKFAKVSLQSPNAPNHLSSPSKQQVNVSPTNNARKALPIFITSSIIIHHNLVWCGGVSVGYGTSVLVGGEEVVEEVLQEDGDHGVGRNPGVIGGEAHPQAQYALVLDALGEAVNESLVGQHTLRV